MSQNVENDKIPKLLGAYRHTGSRQTINLFCNSKASICGVFF